MPNRAFNKLLPEKTAKAHDQITHLWIDDKFNRSNGIEAHKKALQFRSSDSPAKNALDIGCGCTGRFFDLLIEEGIEPEGVDISAEKFRLVKEKYPQLTLYNEDICSWDIPKQYDFITAWDSIWHIPLFQQEVVLTKIVNALNSGGVFIFSFGATDEPGEHTDDSMGPEVYYSTLGTNGFTSLMMKLGCVIKHTELDQYPELHAYMIVQKL